VREQLEAVQKAFWLLLLTSVIIAAAALPLNRNGQLTRVLKELTRFEAGFDRRELEAFLLDSAIRKGEIRLDSVTGLIAGERSPEVEVAEGAPPISPLAAVKLNTLGAVNAFGGDGARVDIAVPDRRQMAVSLGWRLTRRDPARRYRLLGIDLLAGGAGEADVALERRVAAARRTASEAKKAYESTRGQFEQADQFFISLRKSQAHWKPMLEAQEKRDRIREEMGQRQRAMEAALSSYLSLAEKAEEFSGDQAATGDSRATEFGVAVADLASSNGDGEFRIRFPVKLETRSVSVPRLTGADFPAAREAKLFEGMKEMTADEAIRMVRGLFSWHFVHIEVSGFKLGGMTFLQLSPVVLFLVLIILYFRIRKAEASYNPFHNTGDLETLPTIGLKHAALNFLVIMVLPLSACVLCAWSLTLIDRFAVLPVFCGSLILALGVLSHLRMNALTNLRDAVTRSHRSVPPRENP
jgi:hypothetical protein